MKTLPFRIKSRRTTRWAPLLMAAAALASCGGGDLSGDTAHREQPKLVTLGSTPIPADAGTKGMWGPVANWPLIPLHAVLTADGRVLTFGTTETGKQTGVFIYDIWDPSGGLASSSHLTLPNQTATDIFCASAVQLPSGVGVAIAGGDNWTGTGTLNTGNPNTTFFDPSDNSLTRGNNMSRPRWYATSTVLLNGEILVQGGQGGADRADIRGADGSYRQLNPDTSGYSWNYPRNFVAPDGRVFGYDVFGGMYYWNTSGAGTLTYAGGFNATRGEDASAAMFRPGKILQFGGSSNQAIVIDITGGGAPVVTATQPMSTQRRWVTGTLLPDGKVLATGGSRIYNELIDVNTSAEIWDPVSGTWMVGASGNKARLYHSMALLLPDGSVLVGGGGAPGPQINTNVEMYYPAYLFTSSGALAQRPVLGGAPTVTDVGSTIWLDVSSTRPISRVTLIKTGSVTHSFNNEQRFQDLTFSRQGDRLAVQMPTVAGHAPPGHYMLFAIDDAGVPSEAPIIKVNVAPAANPAVTPVLSQPANQTTEAGLPTSLALSATDPNGDVLSYAAAGLPTGLTIDGATGLVSGTPSAAGTFTATVTASDGINAASRTVTWTVTAAATSFTVGLVPETPAPTSLYGTTANFSAQSTGTGIEYSWSFGDGSAATGWSVSGTAQHTFDAAGTYTVTVTARDSTLRTAQYSFLQSVRRSATSGAPVASSGLAMETRGGGAYRVWMVNQDNNTVSVFDGATRARLAEVAVGSGPRALALAADGRMWVTNKASSTVTTIDTASLTVTGAFALPQGSRPHGIVMSPSRLEAYIALEATGQVVKIDTSTLGMLGSAPVGANPRGLSLDGAAVNLYVSRFVTPLQPGEATATVSSVRDGVKTGGEVVVLNPATMTTVRTIVLEHSVRPDTQASGRGVPNYLGTPVISPDGTQAWVPSKQDNIMRGLRRDGLALDFQNTVRAIASRVNLSTQSEDASARVDLDNASLASAAVYDATGVYLFVALETSREVAVVDAHRGAELFRVDAGRAPQSLSVSPDGLTLYVENFMDRTLGAFDLRPLVLSGQASLPAYAATPSIMAERLAPVVLTGKQHFYDARDTRLARDRYMSCASCHSDGGHDGRVWDLSNLGEGLRRTIGLRGKGSDGGQGWRHWSGNFDETQDFEGQIRALAGGTGLMNDAQFNAGTTALPLGDVKVGKSVDLDALAAYLGSLTVHDDSPWYPWTTVPPSVTEGKALFRDLNCASCHGGTAFTSSGTATLFNIGTLKATSGNRLGGLLSGIDPPGLRGLWTQTGYLHDGSAVSIEAAIQAHNNVSVTADQLANLVAYLRTVGAQEPAAPANVSTAGTGLAASYFANTSLGGTPAITRNEAVNFVWIGVGPGAGVPADNWSVRWTGAVQTPQNGTYQFQVIADDGIRVWINGVQIVNRWAGSGNTTFLSAPITSTAGASIPIVIEHFDGTGDSTTKLRWITPGATKYWVPVPLTNLSAAVPNAAPTVALSAPTSVTVGTPVTLSADAADSDGSIAKVEFFDAGVLIDVRTAAPYSIPWTPDTTGVHALTARATDNQGTMTTSTAVAATAAAPNEPPAVTLAAPLSTMAGVTATLSADAIDTDGTISQVEFYDGPTLIATSTTSPYTAAWTPTTAGARALTARATDNAGATTTSAVASVEVTAAPSAGGLRGTYFDNPNLAGTAALVRKEAVTFVWASSLGTSVPGPGVPADNWSVRWSGWVKLPADGTYTLQIIADDGISVRINGQIVATRWGTGGNTTYALLTTTGKAGDLYPVEIEHFDGTGDSTVKLRWKIPNSAYWWDVPAAQLLSN